MAKEWAISFYSSTAWLKCREGYIQSVHGLCERCPEAGVIVHHKEILTPENINDPNVSLNWDKLELTCIDCHNKEHHGSNEPVTRNGLCFNVWGELVRIEAPL